MNAEGLRYKKALRKYAAECLQRFVAWNTPTTVRFLTTIRQSVGNTCQPVQALGSMAG